MFVVLYPKGILLSQSLLLKLPQRGLVTSTRPHNTQLILPSEGPQWMLSFKGRLLSHSVILGRYRIKARDIINTRVIRYPRFSYARVPTNLFTHIIGECAI